MFIASPSCQSAASAAAKSGKVTEEEVAAAFDKLDAYRKRLEAQGQTTGVQARIERYAADLAEKTKIAAEAKKRQAALATIVRQRNRSLMADWRAGGLSPVRALEGLWNGLSGRYAGMAKGRVSVWARKESAKWELIGGLMSEIEREKPHLKRLATDPKFDEDVFTEMSEARKGGTPGKTQNPDAQWLAERFLKYAELARTQANRFGAMIGKLDGWSGVQTHDVDKMVRAGKDAWVGYIASKLDGERTFPDAPSSEEAAQILGDIYDTIITGTPKASDAPTPGGYVSPANLADSLGKHRVLHFKDAATAIAYRNEFGFGTAIGGMFNHLGRMSHVLGLLDGMGPNPEAMFDSLVNETREGVRNDPSISPRQKAKWSKQLTTQSGMLKSAFTIGTGMHSYVGGSETAADIMGGIRTLQRAGKLGGATLTSVPSDTVTSALAAQFRGTSFTRSLMTQLTGMMRGRPKGEQAELAYLTSAAWDGWINHVMRGRLALDSPRGFFGAMEEKFFRFNLLTQTTDLSRGVAGRTMAAEMGMHSKHAYAELNPKYRHVLGLNGIDAPRWEAIRQASLRNVDGRKYLTPDRIDTLDEAHLEPLIADRLAQMNPGANRLPMVRQRLLEQARHDLKHDVIRFFADEASFAVVTPDDATTKWTTWGGSQRGTPAGEIARMVMQFKATPIAFVQRPFARLIYGRRKDAGWGEGVAHFGAYLTGLLLAGYMSMTAKDMVKGYWPPRNPSDPRTMGASLLQSGAMGILGDFLFANNSRFGGGTLETAAGPTLGSVGSGVDALLDLKDFALSGGQDKLSKTAAFNALYGWAPFVNTFYLAPIMNYLWVNSLREALSPGYLRRTARDRERQYGQTSMMPLGPTMAGDLAR